MHWHSQRNASSYMTMTTDVYLSNDSNVNEQCISVVFDEDTIINRLTFFFN